MSLTQKKTEFHFFSISLFSGIAHLWWFQVLSPCLFHIKITSTTSFSRLYFCASWHGFEHRHCQFWLLGPATTLMADDVATLLFTLQIGVFCLCIRACFLEKRLARNSKLLLRPFPVELCGISKQPHRKYTEMTVTYLHRLSVDLFNWNVETKLAFGLNLENTSVAFLSNKWTEICEKEFLSLLDLRSVILGAWT